MPESEHVDPGDLGAKLAHLTASISQLTERGTGVDPVDWNPPRALWATAAPPNQGRAPIIVGEYGISPQGWVTGYLDVRLQGGARTRGNGIYTVPLPAPASVRDPKGFTDVGGGVIGVDLVHKVFRLNTCGAGSGLVRNTSRAVLTIEGGLFAAHNAPFSGDQIDNIHYSFGYWLAETDPDDEE